MINAPSEALELVIDLESDRMQHLVLKDELVASEREVVKNERLQCVDDVVEGAVGERLFREALNARGSEQELFTVFTTYLAGKGLLPKNGCIVDASFVEVPRQRNTREENAAIKEGKLPEGWEKSPKMVAHKDVDARWTKKNEQVFYG
jgi:hypothetical protein